MREARVGGVGRVEAGAMVQSAFRLQASFASPRAAAYTIFLGRLVEAMAGMRGPENRFD